MGRLGGWLGPGLGGSGCKSSESQLSGNGEERRQVMGTGYVRVWSPGSHPRCSHLPRSLVADLHLHVSGMGLCRSVWFVSVCAGT